MTTQGTLVIGGGPAGAAAACRLAQMGRPVTVLERSAGGHDKICGEFMSGEACRDLERLGIDPVALGAVPVDRLRVVHGGRSAACGLPFRGWSLSRRVLDEALLARAAALGADVRRGVSVAGLERDGRQMQPREADWRRDGQVIILASGKHTVRGAVRRALAGEMVGFKMYFAGAREVDAEVQIHLFDGGYAGVEAVEGGRVNLSLLVRRDVVAGAGGSWAGVLRWLLARDPLLERVLDGAAALLERPLTIAGVPYGFLHQSRNDDPDNLYRVGDQMAVIPSFCGDGLAIALRSGMAAAEAIGESSRPMVYHARMRAGLLPQMWAARMIGGVGATRIGRVVLPAVVAHAPALVAAAVRATRVRDTTGYALQNAG